MQRHIITICLGLLVSCGSNNENNGPTKKKLSACFFQINEEQIVDVPVNFKNCSDTAQLEFEWDFGDGNTSIDINPTHTYRSPGNFTVTLVGFQDGTPIDTTSSEVSVSLGYRYYDYSSLVKPIALCELDDGSIIVTGITSDKWIDGWKTFLSKYGTVLNHEWTILSENLSTKYTIRSIENVGNNQLILAGSMNSQNSHQNMITKIDTEGNTIWEKNYDQVDILNEVISDSEGNLLVIGEMQGYAALYKLTSTGEIIWTLDFTDLGYRRASNIIIQNDGYIFSANTGINQFNDSLALNKVDHQGNLIWSVKKEWEPYRIFYTRIVDDNARNRILVTNNGHGLIFSFDYSGLLIEEISTKVSNIEVILPTSSGGFIIGDTKTPFENIDLISYEPTFSNYRVAWDKTFGDRTSFSCSPSNVGTNGLLTRLSNEKILITAISKKGLSGR